MHRIVVQLFILIILLIGFGLRIHQLHTYPPAISSDEAVNIIDAFHIAKTGNFPLYEEQNGRPEPLYRLILTGGVGLWGVSVWGARVLSAFLGVLTIAATARAAREALANWDITSRYIGILVSMTTIAVMIGHITLSRSLFRANIELLIIALSIALALRAVRLHKFRDYVAAGFFGGISLYTYTAAWIFPFGFIFLALSLFIFHFKEWKRWLPGLAITAITAVIVISPLLLLLATHPDRLFGRAGDVVGLTRNWSNILAEAAKQFYATGDENPQYNVALAPILSRVWWYLFLIGLGILVTRITSRYTLFLLSLLILFNIPVIASNEITHGLRIANEYVIVSIIAGIGGAGLIEIIRRLRPKLLQSTWMMFVTYAGLAVLLISHALIGWQTYQAYWDNADNWKRWQVYGYDLNHNEWFFRTDRQDFAAWLVKQPNPILMPMSELERITTRVWLLPDYPNVVTADESYQLPPDTSLVLPFSLEINDYITDTRDFAVLNNHKIILLPQLSKETHQQLIANQNKAETITLDNERISQLAQIVSIPDDFKLNFAPINDLSNSLVQFNNSELNLSSWSGLDTYHGEEILPITLMWSPQRRIGHEYSSFVQLQTQDYQRLSGTEHLIRRWLYPSSIWQIGDVVPDTHELPIPANLDAGAYRLSTGLYYSNYQSVSFSGGLPTDLTNMATIGWYKVPQKNKVLIPDTATSVNAIIADLFELEAFQIIQGDDGLYYAALFWQSVENRPPIDATIFVHLVDADNNIVAQSDNRPWNGQYPTFIWDEGERVETIHTLNSEGFTLDKVSLRVGMYTFPGPTNLPAIQGTNTYLEGVIPLGAATTFFVES